MSNEKISQLAVGVPLATDLSEAVDTTDISMGPTGTNKKYTRADELAWIATELAAGNFATKSQVQRFAFSFATAGGTGNALTALLSPVPASLQDGMLFIISASASSTSTSPTLNINGLGAKDITLSDGSDLVSGDLLIGVNYLMSYDADGDVFQVINPSISVATAALVQQNYYNKAVTTGGTTAYSASFAVTPQPFGSTGAVYTITMNATNTGASTLQVGITVYTLTNNSGGALVAGQLISGETYLIAANGSNLQVLNPSGTTVTPSALTRTDDTNVTLTLGGTPASALLQSVSLTLGWTGQLAISRGGTGLSALGTGVQTALGQAVTGSGSIVLASSPTLLNSLDLNGDGSTVSRITRASSDATQSLLRLRKARGSISSPTVVNVNDDVGTIFFDAYDGSSYVGIGELNFGVAGVSGSNISGDFSLRTNNSSGSMIERYAITNQGLHTFSGAGIRINSGSTLDSYETGTFTPTYAFETPGTSSFAYAVQLGFYTRIGNIAYVRIYIQATMTIGTASGAITIGTLPYVPGDNNTSFMPSISGLGQSMAAVSGWTQYEGQALNSSLVRLRYNRNAQNTTTLSVASGILTSGNVLTCQAQFFYTI